MPGLGPTKHASIFRMLVSRVCEQCQYRWSMPISNYLPNEPAMTGFYHEHGIEFDFATDEQFSLLLDVEKELLPEDPLRIRLTIPLDGDEPRLTFDDERERRFYRTNRVTVGCALDTRLPYGLVGRPLDLLGD